MKGLELFHLSSHLVPFVIFRTLVCYLSISVGCVVFGVFCGLDQTRFYHEIQQYSCRGMHSFFGCVLVYWYTKERNINELRHNSMYGYENDRNSPLYRYTRTAPFFFPFFVNSPAF